MTWNEWKAGSNSAMGDRFYVYLVGGLRSDLADGVPFVRTIHDPVHSLRSQEARESGERRSVQLFLPAFKVAHELTLDMLPGPPDGT